MERQEVINNMVRFLFKLQLNMKMYHWLTTSYARHKASDEFGSTIASVMDKFVEVYIGKYNVKPNSGAFKVEVNPMFSNDEGNAALLKDARIFIQEIIYNSVDSELQNILDELTAEIDKTLYLYNLK